MAGQREVFEIAYDLLAGLRVLEFSNLSRDALGGHLADLGAEVIKVEGRPSGVVVDDVRVVSPYALGTPDGPSPMHLRWNRGKKSVALDLHTPGGRSTFLDLARTSHVVIEGVRAGTLEGLGLGCTELRRVNPQIVFAHFSGFGAYGPYRNVSTHGMFFDAYAGLIQVVESEDGTTVRISSSSRPLVGILAGALYAGMGVLAAVIKAQRTDQGVTLDIAQADAAAMWKIGRQGALDLLLNRDKLQHRRMFGPPGGVDDSVRNNCYRTKDGRVILLQALERVFWENFCRGVGRTDLLDTAAPEGLGIDNATGNERLRRELQAIFGTRTQAEWVAFMSQHNVAGGPLHTADDLLSDPHFAARSNVYSFDHPTAGRLRLSGTPVKVEGSEFAPRVAPDRGQDTVSVLAAIGYDERRIDDLRRAGAIPNASGTTRTAAPGRQP